MRKSPPVTTMLMLLAAGPSLYSGESFFVAPELFEFQGSWEASEMLGRACLLVRGPKHAKQDAVTVVDIPASSDYTFWAAAFDFPDDKPGTRRFRVGVDGTLFKHEAGAHSTPDKGERCWKWEKVGAKEISRGRHLLFVSKVTDYARFGGVFLTSDRRCDPNRLSMNELRSYSMEPVEAEVRGRKPSFMDRPRLAADVDVAPLHSIGNNRIELRFVRTVDRNGAHRIERRCRLFSQGRWIKMPLEQDERLFVLETQSGEVSDTYYPKWIDGGIRTEILGSSGTSKVISEGSSENPFCAGDMTIFHVTDVSKLGTSGLEVTYRSEDGRKTLNTRWELIPGSTIVEVTAQYVLGRDTFCGIGFSAGPALGGNGIEAVQMPPMAQMRRLHETPKLLTVHSMPMPVSMAQARVDGKSFTWSVIGDPTAMPFDRMSFKDSPYGFSIVNPDGEVQPTIFTPIPGFKGSKCSKGSSLRRTWLIDVRQGTWEDAFRDITQNVYELADYRQPNYASLTEAILSMFDLLKDADAVGYVPKRKAFENIEKPNESTSTANLMLMSAALLSRDEELYETRALDGIQFVLTRAVFHFSNVMDYHREMKIGSERWGTSDYASFDSLTNNANPWLVEHFAMPGGKPTTGAASWGGAPQWSQELAAYRHTPDPARLGLICKMADESIASDFDTAGDAMSDRDFYNISCCPYWHDYLELYELTGRKGYLEAARKAAYLTVAGVFIWPIQKSGPVTINKDNLSWCKGGFIPWYRYGRKYRLGYPREKGSLIPPKTADASLVSRVGLGFEQPCTQFYQGRTVFMSSWAPSLLRYYQHSKDEYFRTYARNAVIGRMANYPGYYLFDYSDLVLKPDYPYVGPDISRLYFMHIPAHLMFATDFLFTQASARSAGKITFPFTVQQGYAWFHNRVYGMNGGKVYDFDGLRPIIKRGLVDPGRDIDWIAGSSPDRFFLVLMSQADGAIPIDLNLNASNCGIDASAKVVAYINGARQAVEFAEIRNLEIPAKGLVALAFEARYDEVLNADIRPVSDGFKRKKLGGIVGEVGVFRIRSEFGKDAIYAAATGGFGEDGYVMELDVNGQKRTVGSFPFEASVYPFGMNEDAQVRLTFKTNGGAVVHDEVFEMRQ